MYSIQHINVHSNPFTASFRRASHFLEISKKFIWELIISFKKAQEVARIVSRDPYSYNQEAIKKIMLEG